MDVDVLWKDCSCLFACPVHVFARFDTVFKTVQSSSLDLERGEPHSGSLGNEVFIIPVFVAFLVSIHK